ncbi:axin-1-like isoform X2 [Dreissena polymorpha]|uniref:axin-1-like isoform X2 n=1 Tax=Dreissena polymorpha TaxID=45954 RepID=UPI002264464E|nr:axin-1-like isoform X2 [Dreissena polymorpha]
MSSSKVDMFLLNSGGTNFTETAPRPPVPGEENEKESNGGMSTKSSGSHKSQVSHTSGRSVSSNKGDINPATPRKSNIEKPANVNLSICGIDDDDAPLGFEPEGSATNSPPFTENSTPPYLKWAESLHNLLDDHDGVKLFRNFLDQEEIGSASIDFWFACQGLKKKPKNSEEIPQLIKLMRTIYKKYIKGDRLPFIDYETKRIISESISLQKSDVDVTLFDDVQAQVETYMKSNTYPLFLKSDLYVQYVSKEGVSPKSSNSSSSTNSRPVSSGPLPTLQEDQELGASDLSCTVMGPPPIRHHSRPTHVDTVRPEALSSLYPYHPRPVSHHNSYAPVSAQDSELQSLSSQDTFSEDAQSITDSSIDGHSYRERRTRRGIRLRRPPPNRENEHEPFIPRPDRGNLAKDRNIAETDCPRFAKMLIEKLQAVVDEIEKQERMQNSLNAIRNEGHETLDRSNVSNTSIKNNTTSTSLPPLLTSSFIEEENADSILDEHCSRIWERSAQQTPSRSPGRHSPHSKSPDRFRKPLPHSGSASMSGTLQHVRSSQSKKRTNMSHSMSSFDSGMGDDLNKCVETHKHIHHHHHHHHEKQQRKNKQRLELQAQQHSMVCWGDGTAQHHGVRSARQKARVSSDVCSNLDSGISMVESCPATQDLAIDPAQTKVLQWIMDNENMNRGTSSAYTDSDRTSSTQKRSHKSALTPVPQQPYKHSSKKSSSGHSMNRSASVDSGSRVPWVGGDAGVMPSQPFVQDPSMPLMPPPNTRVQLEEVNRRLYAGDTSGPIKSKSSAGPMAAKDRRPVMSISMGSGQDMCKYSSTVPADLDLSTDSFGRRVGKRTSGSGNTSNMSGCSRPEEITIGYYFCGDPIPYKTTIPQSCITLGQFKQHSKRGNFRYFVKTFSNDFDSEAVYEEVREDLKYLPVYDGKVLVKIERKDDLDSSNKSSGSEKKFQS